MERRAALVGSPLTRVHRGADVVWDRRISKAIEDPQEYMLLTDAVIKQVRGSESADVAVRRVAGASADGVRERAGSSLPDATQVAVASGGHPLSPTLLEHDAAAAASIAHGMTNQPWPPPARARPARQIEADRDPAMRPAQEVIRKIRRRELYRFVDEVMVEQRHIHEVPKVRTGRARGSRRPSCARRRRIDGVAAACGRGAACKR